MSSVLSAVISSVLSNLDKVIAALVPALKPWFLKTFSGVHFTYPLHGGSVSRSEFLATWKYRWHSKTTKFAIFHLKKDSYWPQGAPRNDPTYRTLEKEVSIGDPVHPGAKYTLIIAAVTDDFRVAIRHYIHVNETLEKVYGIDTCIPLVIRENDKPPGLIELDRVVFGVE